jgi:excinuclease UvrABC ATPase subunit
LAKNGLIYTQWHTTAVCSPTRSCFLTGRNHHANGFGSISEAAMGYRGYNGHIPLADAERGDRHIVVLATQKVLQPALRRTCAIVASLTTICEECEGRRFQASVLGYRLGKLNIAEVLDLSVEDAVVFFNTGEAHNPAAHAILQPMADVGLGYLRLGQPLTTLSGGERQRIKLATHVGEEGGVYVLDELTTGLHLADLAQLLALLDRLVDSAKSVIVIEHHQSVMAHADWIIDLGPGAGHDGGRVVFEGTPADLVAARSTMTGEVRR